MKLLPRVLLDVDGVLADFLTPAIKIINEVTGQSFSNEDVKDWNMFKSLELSKEIEDLCYQRFNEPDYALTLKPYDGAQEAVNTLSNICEVYAVTSPIKTSKTWNYDRRLWLEKYFNIPHKNIVYTSAKHVISGDILVDDSPENIISWKKHNKGEGILWAQCYNENVKDEFQNTRFNDWKLLFNLVDYIAKYEK